MGSVRHFGTRLDRTRWLGMSLVGASLLVWLYFWLKHAPTATDPLFFGYLEILGGVIALACAASALVRFRGTHDHVSLLVALGFLLAGSIQTVTSFAFFTIRPTSFGLNSPIPFGWTLSQGLLAGLLAASLIVEKRVPFAKHPNRELIATLVAGALSAYLATYFLVLTVNLIRSEGPAPQPWHLVPGAIFLLSAIGFGRRIRRADDAFDHALCYAAVMNVGCQLAASSATAISGPMFAFAEVVKVSSYAVVLGGALVDSGRLFEQVQLLASTDPLTALANYRRFLEVLDQEIKRCQRTGRKFALLLLDLDGLKTINDRYGHLVGSRALIRLAQVLRVHCREIDTAARYGGDEFALVLPESDEAVAWQVAGRIRDRLANDGERPAVSVSVGVAMYPRDGATIEKLLGAADRDLYAMKERSGLKMARIAGAAHH